MSGQSYLIECTGEGRYSFGKLHAAGFIYETPCQKVICLTCHSDMMEDVSNLRGWLAVHCS
jgi:hypothetical protein